MRPFLAASLAGLLIGLVSFSNVSQAEETSVPYALKQLQSIEATYGVSDYIDGETLEGLGTVELDIRKEAIREAALSFGARGSLARRNYQIMSRLETYEDVLDRVFNFRQLLIKAPSGLLIEPPIVRESNDALIIEQGGIEAAVADKIYNISKEAKIVTAPRDWRHYIERQIVELKPPPRILWPINKEEEREWRAKVAEGWDAGYTQADDIFEANLEKLVGDFKGMVRYRVLLSQGMVSQPYALHEDRGVTGGGNEMRIGDRAVRITGPSQLQAGVDVWKPADR